MEALALVLALAREINGVGSFQLTMFSRYRRSSILPRDVGGVRYVRWTVVEQPLADTRREIWLTVLVTAQAGSLKRARLGNNTFE
jgi:hypothetical protein